METPKIYTYKIFVVYDQKTETGSYRNERVIFKTGENIIEAINKALADPEFNEISTPEVVQAEKRWA